MNVERLAEIRAENGKVFDPLGWVDGLILQRAELLAYVDDLTRQLDEARDKAINAGIFTSTDGDESKYTHALNTDTCEDCGESIIIDGGYCVACDLETSTPGATSYKP